jgi:GT2 family glycosyltransferase
MTVEQLPERDGMELSIVIVNWNTRELLADCLRSVYETAGSLRFEIFVVDNASTDGSVEMVHDQFSTVHLLENQENVGFARANNQAVCHCSGRYVLLLNSDTEVYADALDSMVQFMESHAQAGGCGPRLLNTDGSLQVSAYPMLTPEREFWRLIFLDQLWRRASYNQERWDPLTAHPVDVIIGACLLLRRTVLEEVGLLDENYFMYTEEVDLCYRLAQAGWELWWVPWATVAHHGGASARQIAEEMYIQLYHSKARFYRKFGGRHRVVRYRFLIGMAYVARLVIASACAPFSAQLGTQARVYRRLLAELPGM